MPWTASFAPWRPRLHWHLRGLAPSPSRRLWWWWGWRGIELESGLSGRKVGDEAESEITSKRGHSGDKSSTILWYEDDILLITDEVAAVYNKSSNNIVISWRGPCGPLNNMDDSMRIPCPMIQLQWWCWQRFWHLIFSPDEITVVARHSILEQHVVVLNMWSSIHYNMITNIYENMILFIRWKYHNMILFSKWKGPFANSDSVCLSVRE